MEGSLCKLVEQKKLFQRTPFPKRYFVLDFAIARIFIYNNRKEYYKDEFQPDEEEKTENEKSDVDKKTMLFRDIIECYSLNDSIIGKNNYPKDMYYPFCVKTN